MAIGVSSRGRQKFQELRVSTSCHSLSFLNEAGGHGYYPIVINYRLRESKTSTRSLNVP